MRYTSLLSDASSHWAFNLVDVLSHNVSLFSTTCVGCCCTCESDFPSSSHYTSCENVKILWFFQKTESVKMYCCPKMKNSVHPQFSLIVSIDVWWVLAVEGLSLQLWRTLVPIYCSPRSLSGQNKKYSSSTSSSSKTAAKGLQIRQLFLFLIRLNDFDA